MAEFRKIPFAGALLLISAVLGVEAAGSCDSMGLSALAVFDLLVIMTVALIGAPFLLSHATVGRTQGVATLVISVVILGSALLILGLALALLFTMLASLPLYLLFHWNSFPLPKAYGLLSVAMLCKFGFTACIIVSHQKFLTNTGLVVIVLTSLLLTMMLSVLYGMPRVIVIVTDDLGAIVIASFAAFRSIGFILASLPAMKKALGV